MLFCSCRQCCSVRDAESGAATREIIDSEIFPLYCAVAFQSFAFLDKLLEKFAGAYPSMTRISQSSNRPGFVRAAALAAQGKMRCRAREAEMASGGFQLNARASAVVGFRALSARMGRNPSLHSHSSTGIMLALF